MTLNGLNGHFTLNFHYYELNGIILLAGFESIIYLFAVKSVCILVTSGDVGSGVADRDPQNIWNPRKKPHRRNLNKLGQHKYLVLLSPLSPLTPKHVTFNELQWPSCDKFCFALVCLEL